ncbi:Thioredoxin-like protein CXXS1 [Hibiscus syriacus]|uniref:Thioredoxin-like protein CXXS1 n=1 Tax=Hibiscus syriacus TaxID=106335 RepID=A0A6A3AKN8_HIBSY|nr:thioredoxin-like protein CXXS1 [Hibiscus syriacus]KAE8704047.1 Thioredoxin-like protein CXXS1 [Hibiscus syriacus]
MDMNRKTKTPASRVVRIDSEQSWDFFITQANGQGCPIMVHFTAAWCVPSVAMSPLFEQLAFTYQDVLFLSVDVDDVQEAASKMEITAMPTFLLMNQGTHVNKLVGANHDAIKKMIADFVLHFRSSKLPT